VRTRLTLLDFLFLKTSGSSIQIVKKSKPLFLFYGVNKSAGENKLYCLSGLGKAKVVSDGMKQFMVGVNEPEYA
jgi:hypothetical protein